MSVLVVGAGLAGLVAARDISRQGHEVVVVEARERVGGRVRSHSFADGTVVELGGEWIESSHHAVLGLASELGLSLVDTGQDFSTRDLIGEPPIPEAQHRRLTELLMATVRGTSPPNLEEMSVADVLAEVGDTGPAMRVLRSRLEGTYAVPLSEIGAGGLDGEFGIGDGTRYVRVEGGNDLLAKEMSSGLDVRLGVAVQRVALHGERVVVSTTSGEMAADLAVLAVPLPILREEGFLAEPPEQLTSSLGMIGMGTAAKVAAATDAPPPMFRRQDPDIPAWYWTGASSDGSTRRAVTGFAGTHRGASTLIAEAKTRLSAAAPDVAFSGQLVSADWGSDPWARGCYTAIGPGKRNHLKVLARPWGRVVFAGEHVNGSGTIDGAVRSGIHASEQALTLLRG